MLMMEISRSHREVVRDPILYLLGVPPSSSPLAPFFSTFWMLTGTGFLTGRRLSPEPRIRSVVESLVHGANIGQPHDQPEQISIASA